MYLWTDGAYLMHHGIKGQKWGVRRYQNSDGSLTSAGRSRYGVGERLHSIGAKAASSIKDGGNAVKEKWNSLSDRQKTAIKVGAAVAATALVAYGAYKLDNKIFNDRLNKANSIIEEGRVSMAKFAEKTLDLVEQAKSDDRTSGFTTTGLRMDSPEYKQIQDARDRRRVFLNADDPHIRRSVSYVGRDGRTHTANSAVNMLTGDYSWNDRTGADLRRKITNRDELREFERNHNNFRRKQKKTAVL